MKTCVCRLGMAFFLASLAIRASAAESWKAVPAPAAAPPAAATDAPPTTVERSESAFQAIQISPGVSDTQVKQGGAENRVFFVTGEGAEQAARRMQERLADPEQRVALRAEQRASIQQQHPEAVRVLGLDAATEHQLIERLTDRQMSQLERMFGGSRPHGDNNLEAQATTRHLDALSELLGEEGLDRFQDYKATLGERRQVGLFTKRLKAGNELRPDQEDRLVALLHDQNQRRMEDVWMPESMLQGLEGRRLPSREELQRESQLSTIAANEAVWRRRQVTNRELEKQAAEFLTPAQLAEMSKYQAQEQERLQRWIESARAQAGMDPRISEQPATRADAADARGKLVDGQVQIEIRVTVNRGEPTIVTQKVRNGESFSFAAAEGLIAEATPTLYEDHRLHMHMNFYEQRAAGKRRLHGGGNFGVQTRMPDGTPNQGGMTTLISGRKGYAIEVMAGATAL